MIRKIKSVKFLYRGRIELEEDIKNKINDNWDELSQRSNLLTNGEILVVSKLDNKDDNYEIELKSTSFAHYMYSKKYNDMCLNCMFSGSYIITSDNYVSLVLNNVYKDSLYEVINLVGGMSDTKDIVDGRYDSFVNLEREFKEELGLELDDNYEVSLKYLKCPSEKENSIGYSIGTIYEVKTIYTKEQLIEMFNNSKHDNEIKEIVFFSKENYKDLYKIENKKEYILDLWKFIFNESL